MNKQKVIYLIGIILITFACNKETVEVIPENDFAEPFSANSIWKREIPTGNTYFDINDAIWGDPLQAPNRVSAELVTLCYVDESQPEVKFYKSEGWFYPERSRKEALVFYSRRLNDNSGTEVRFPNTGNGSFVIINTKNGIADEGSAGWREPGEDFITFFDEPRLHNIDLNGEGLKGTLGSGLPALGGLLRKGEFNSVINHSLAISTSSRRFSKDIYYVYPASQGDGFASNPIYGYLGNNQKYTMGTLLAIPYSINIDSISWETQQGYNFAIANQKYGWYIIDSSTGGVGGDLMKFSFERNAAYYDLGLEINHSTNEVTVDPNKINFVGFQNDVNTIMQLVKATTK